MFSKSYPRHVGKSTYPTWEEITLDDKEEKEIERKATVRNVELMEKCIENAKKIFKIKGLKDFQSDVVKVAVALFEKRASHEVFHKESVCKKKFDEKFK